MNKRDYAVQNNPAYPFSVVYMPNSPDGKWAVMDMSSNETLPGRFQSASAAEHNALERKMAVIDPTDPALEGLLDYINALLARKD